MTNHTPEEIMKAHQYLYYVKARPVLSDREYDQFCKANGLFGGGGSDCEDHYSEAIKKLARDIRAGKADCL